MQHASDKFDLCLVINCKIIIVWQINGKHKSFQVVNLLEGDRIEFIIYFYYIYNTDLSFTVTIHHKNSH